MRAQATRQARKRRAQNRHPGVPDSIELLKDKQVTRRATLPRLLGNRPHHARVPCPM